MDVWSSCSDIVFFFFFSSRRRHTRLTCDWSSDVCSSDLASCPTINSFTATTSNIVAGGSSTLQWSTSNAAQVLLNGNPVSTSGSVTVTPNRSEEHTSELQSHVNLVCRLLLEKKKKRRQKK